MWYCSENEQYHMILYKVVLTFETVDETLGCDHLNVLFVLTIFQNEIQFCISTLERERVNHWGASARKMNGSEPCGTLAYSSSVTSNSYNFFFDNILFAMSFMLTSYINKVTLSRAIH